MFQVTPLSEVLYTAPPPAVGTNAEIHAVVALTGEMLLIDKAEFPRLISPDVHEAPPSVVLVNCCGSGFVVAGGVGAEPS